MVTARVVVLLVVVLLVGVAPVAPPAAAAPQPLPATRSARLPALRDAQPARDAAGRRLSAAVPAPMPFSLLGGTAPPGTEVEARTSVDGRTWGSWLALPEAEHDGPDETSAEGRAWRRRIPRGRVPTLPLWTGRALWLQVRVAGASPRDVELTVIDTLGQSRGLAERVGDAVAAALRRTPRAVADTDQPEIVTRAQWGADEDIGGPERSYAERVRFGVVHHTAGSNTYSQADAAAVVRAIQRYHVEANGWSDIGYHFLIDRFGTIYEGRSGGIDRPVVGAHAGGFNTGSFGVAVMGTFASTPPSTEAVSAMTDLLAWKMDVHHVDVTSRLSARSRGSTRYPDGEIVELDALSGHRDVSETLCPGAALYDLVPALRSRVVEAAGPVLLDDRAEPHEVTVARGRPLDPEVVLSARLRPPGRWTVEIRDPEGEVVHRVSGSGEHAQSSWVITAPLLGEHTYRITSPGRRTAAGTITLAPPTISDAAASPPAVRRDGSALLVPVRVTAELYRGASWQLEITDPAGEPVLVRQGVGEVLDETWAGPVGEAGTYTWTITADDAEPASGTVEVYAGVLARVADEPDPVAGAVAASRTAFPARHSAERAVLARSDRFADALAGGPLAGTGGPVLLTASDELDERVVEELRRVLPPDGTVYVLGGPGAVAPIVVEDLEREWAVERLSGPDRVATAAAVAEEVVARTGARRALVARAGPDAATPWADAVAGGAYGAAAGVPVLLTDSSTLSGATAEALAELDIEQTAVLGGPAAVADAVMADLPGAVRVHGPDRAATAVAVARELWGRRTAGADDRIVLVGGYRPDAWTRALTASPLAARNGAPLLLADASELPPATRDYLAGLGYDDDHQGAGWVLGGPVEVGEAVADQVDQLLQ